MSARRAFVGRHVGTALDKERRVALVVAEFPIGLAGGLADAFASGAPVCIVPAQSDAAAIAALDAVKRALKEYFR